MRISSVKFSIHFSHKLLSLKQVNQTKFYPQSFDYKRDKLSRIYFALNLDM